VRESNHEALDTSKLIIRTLHRDQYRWPGFGDNPTDVAYHRRDVKLTKR
jgi:hypothetical protein